MGSAQAAAQLFTAASAGRIEKVKELIGKNEDLLRASDEEGIYPGFTALHWCVLGMPQADLGTVKGSAHMDVARFLIDESVRLSQGGDDEAKIFDTPDISDDTPLHLAVSWGQVELARLMIDSGASTSIKNKNKLSPLELASPAMKAKLTSKPKP